VSAQCRVFRVVEHYMGAWPGGGSSCSQTRATTSPATASNAAPTTRKGTPCQRMPLPHNGYCPSHQHLADTEEVVLAA
jgi:hypothetical protein